MNIFSVRVMIVKKSRDLFWSEREKKTFTRSIMQVYKKIKVLESVLYSKIDELMRQFYVIFIYFCSFLECCACPTCFCLLGMLCFDLETLVTVSIIINWCAHAVPVH